MSMNRSSESSLTSFYKQTRILSSRRLPTSGQRAKRAQFPIQLTLIGAVE